MLSASLCRRKSATSRLLVFPSPHVSPSPSQLSDDRSTRVGNHRSVQSNFLLTHLTFETTKDTGFGIHHVDTRPNHVGVDDPTCRLLVTSRAVEGRRNDLLVRFQDVGCLPRAKGHRRRINASRGHDQWLLMLAEQEQYKETTLPQALFSITSSIWILRCLVNNYD